jgi:uncharacterized protein (DUF952 family)
MSVIYHVTTIEEWETAKKTRFYAAASLASEGFIHCSEERQVAGVLERYFSGKNGLIKLVIDTEKLTSKLVTEWSPTAKDNFPHVYGPINLDAVVEVKLIQ